MGRKSALFTSSATHIRNHAIQCRRRCRDRYYQTRHVFQPESKFDVEEGDEQLSDDAEMEAGSEKKSQT